MSETDDPTPSVEPEAGGTPPAPVADPPKAEPKTEAELPDWAREKLTKANGEAAKYRTEKNDAVNAAKAEAKAAYETQITELTDKGTSLTSELAKATSDLSKIKVALSVGIPGESAAEFADLLKGENDAELKAHAEKLKTLFGDSVKPGRAVDPTQGANGTGAVDVSPGLDRLRNAYANSNPS
jgi:hypothetical protein